MIPIVSKQRSGPELPRAIVKPLMPSYKDINAAHKQRQAYDVCGGHHAEVEEVP